jgi:hypothetical protein
MLEWLRPNLFLHAIHHRIPADLTVFCGIRMRVIEPRAEEASNPIAGVVHRRVEREENTAFLAWGCRSIPADQKADDGFGELCGFVEHEQVARLALMFLLIVFVLDGAELDHSAVSRTPDMQAVIVTVSWTYEYLARVFDQAADGRKDAAEDDRAAMLCGCKAEAEKALSTTCRAAVANDVSVAIECVTLWAVLGLPNLRARYRRRTRLRDTQKRPLVRLRP